MAKNKSTNPKRTPTSLSEPTKLNSSEVEKLLRNAWAAKAILRTVILAVKAQEDGSISYDDKAGTERWSPALGEVCCRLGLVRDVLMNNGDHLAIDWYTPLILAEALDAALWHGYTCAQQVRLDCEEFTCAAQVVVDSIDELLIHCDDAGLLATPRESSASNSCNI